MISNYALFNIAIRGDSSSRYTIDVHSDLGGDASGSFVSPSDVPAYQLLINRLLQLDTNEKILAELGQLLFQSIFQAAIKDVYARSQGRLAVDQGLRLRFDIHPDLVDIAGMPWEFLYDPDRGALALLDTPIVRYIPQQAALPILAAPLPLKVLVTGAVTPPAPAVERELSEVLAALAPLEQARQVSVHIEEHLTPTTLQRRLREGYHIWHFIGHGGLSRAGGSAALLFEDETGASTAIAATQLGYLLNRSGVRLIVLNACNSGRLMTDLYHSIAPALVRAQTPAVVAMQFSVPQETTRIFAGEFYRALAEALPIDACVTEGRKAVMLAIGAGNPDWGIPVVYTRAADGQLFTPPQSQGASSEVSTPAGPRNSVVSIAGDMHGDIAGGNIIKRNTNVIIDHSPPIAPSPSDEDPN